MADALFSASFLNACLRHSEHVTMANVAPLVNTRGPLFVHPNGIVKRTSFHTMAIYANLLKESVVKADVQADELRHGDASVAVIDAIATVDGGGENFSIALVNRHPSDEVDCTVKLGKTLLEGIYKTTVLDGESPDAYNDIENPDRVVPREMEIHFRNGVASLPPHSLSLIEISL